MSPEDEVIVQRDTRELVEKYRQCPELGLLISMMLGNQLREIKAQREARRAGRGL